MMPYYYMKNLQLKLKKVVMKSLDQLPLLEFVKKKNDYLQFENYVGKLKTIAPNHSFLVNWGK